jgi:hypothetical protein
MVCHWIPDQVGNDEKKGGGNDKRGRLLMTGEWVKMTGEGKIFYWFFDSLSIQSEDGEVLSLLVCGRR